MIKFLNTNDQFGEEGPFEADSKEALADSMEESFGTHPEDYGAMQTVDGMREDFIAGLVAVWTGEPRIIFDNGGWVTLQLPEFAHAYDDAGQCANDLKDWIEDENTDDWEGNEEDAVFEPTENELDNGGYVVKSLDEFTGMSLDDLLNEGWGNISGLYAALVAALMEVMKSKKCAPCRYCGNKSPMILGGSAIGIGPWIKCEQIACKKCGAMGPVVACDEFPQTPNGLNAKDEEICRRWNVINGE